MDRARYILPLLGLLATAVDAIETEPDWNVRYQVVKQEYIDGFKPPAAGETVTITRRIGGELTGQLSALSPESVTVAGQKFEPRQLTDDTCEQLFAEVFAARAAREQVLKERDNYRERRTAEQKNETVTTRSIADTTVPRSASTVERTAPSAPEAPTARASAPANTTSVPAKPTPNERQSGAWTVVAVLIGVIVFFSVVSKCRRQVRKLRMIAEANAYLTTIKSEQRLQPILTSLMLKKGEQAYMEAACSLNESRSIRHHQRGGVGFRVAKGVYVGGSKGTSHSVPQMTRIDSGKLILTNKRLVFDGSHEDRNIALNKIASLNQFINAIEVSSETRQKSMFFTVPNPLLWATVIRILSAVDDPNDISGDTIDIQFA